MRVCVSGWSERHRKCGTGMSRRRERLPACRVDGDARQRQEMWGDTRSAGTDDSPETRTTSNHE